MALKPPVEVPQGAIRLNTDSQKMEFFAQDQWWEMATDVHTLQGGARGIFSGQNVPSGPSNTAQIDAINIASQGNAFDFGDNSEARRGGGQCGSRTRALLGGGYNDSGSRVPTIDYVTISSTGNAADFGDRTLSANAVGAVSNQTRGIFHGGVQPSVSNIIDYVTIATTGNAQDFGDSINTNANHTGMGSPTRGIIGGNGPDGEMEFITIPTLGNGTEFGNNLLDGRTELPGGGSNSTRGIYLGGETQPAGNRIDRIQYITIPTLGNATDFGNLSAVRRGGGGCASPIRVLYAGGNTAPANTIVNTIEYVTIATTGDATDFGDLAMAKSPYNGTSNAHGGL